MQTQFEKSRFPWKTVLTIALLAILSFEAPNLWQLVKPAPKTYSWTSTQVCTVGEELRYFDNATHKQVAKIFHCGQGDGWNVFSIETSITTNEDYQTREQAIARVEALFK